MDTDQSKKAAGNWKGGQETEDVGQERTGETEQKMKGKNKSQKGWDGKRTGGGLAEGHILPFMKAKMPRQGKGPCSGI